MSLQFVERSFVARDIVALTRSLTLARTDLAGLDTETFFGTDNAFG